MKNYTGGYHGEIVKRALSEGKPVPPEVLAEYPDLTKPTKETGLSPSEMGKAMRIPKLFMDTPIDELQNMVASGEGGEGAKKALDIRKGEIAETKAQTIEAPKDISKLAMESSSFAEFTKNFKQVKGGKYCI